MKKTIIAMAAFAAAFTMASCVKEQFTDPEAPIAGNDVVTAFTESSLTKTSLSGSDSKGYEVVWSEGDTFKIGDSTFTLIDGANTTSGKFQGTLPEGDGPFTAYYPATYNGTDWPASQDYTPNNITGSPMTAEFGKGEESLSFKNKGGILRLKVKGIATIKTIKVSAVGLNEITLNCGSVTLNDTTGVVFHIAMPEGDYEGTSIYFRTTEDDYCFKELKAGMKLKIVRSEITTASFTASFTSSDSTEPLRGVFSIAEGKQIRFSRGNLYYDGGFKFESRQYAFHGYDYYSDAWGLFGWSTATTNYGMSTINENSSYSGAFVDWGKAIDTLKTWHTLTEDEWQYLLETRPNASDKYGFGRVYGTYGLIILPDEFTDPMKNNGSGPFVPEMGYSNFYTLGGNWEAMEAAGAVFLPIAGYRGGTNVYSVTDYGMYWSSSADGEEKAYYLNFMLGSIRFDSSDGRRTGHSVRLVTNLYTVTLDMNGKDCTAPESLKEIQHGSTITKPADPTAEGYVLSGWYKDTSCTEKWNFDSDKVTKDTVLYAKWMELPDGAINGNFSVANGKKVCFSKGNLTCDISGQTPKWGFYENQYDGAAAGMFDNKLISLFTWGYNGTKSIIPNGSATDNVSRSSGDLSQSEDWGSQIGNGTTWRTLTNAEWKYLLSDRKMTYGKARYTLNIIYEGKTGLVLYPDNYNGSTLISGTQYTDDTFPAGCVFLPASGIRLGSMVGINGYYWTSSAKSSTLAYEVHFTGDGVYYGSADTNCAIRNEGRSVRLITDVK